MARIGKDDLLDQSHPNHLVLDDVRGHADQGEVLDLLPDHLVGGMGDEVGEPFEGGRVARAQVFGTSLIEALELGLIYFQTSVPAITDAKAASPQTAQPETWSGSQAAAATDDSRSARATDATRRP
jgi:hypothetical protein